MPDCILSLTIFRNAEDVASAMAQPLPDTLSGVQRAKSFVGVWGVSISSSFGVQRAQPFAGIWGLPSYPCFFLAAVGVQPQQTKKDLGRACNFFIFDPYLRLDTYITIYIRTLPKIIASHIQISP